MIGVDKYDVDRENKENRAGHLACGCVCCVCPCVTSTCAR